MAQGGEGRRTHPRGHEPYGDDILARRPYGPQPGPSGQHTAGLGALWSTDEIGKDDGNREAKLITPPALT